MKADDKLTTAPNDYCFAAAGEVYAIYLPDGGTTELRLEQGRYTVKWYDPRSGGPLQDGTVGTLNGPGSRSIGDPPSARSRDWAVLITRAK